VRKFILIGLVILAAGVAAAAVVYRPDKALRVVTALISHTLCSETFVAGLDPDQTYRETFGDWPVVRRLLPAIRYEVDRAHREVRATLAGAFASRAVYRDGLGCVQAPAGSVAPGGMVAAWKADPKPIADGPDIAPPQIVEPADPRLRSALDRAFAEPEGGPQRATKAVVVYHDGRIVAERYAPGYGIDTPLYGYSVTKSVVNALVGILVRQGRLSMDGPAPVAAWHDPADPRHAITVEQLMRMTSGLALDEVNNGFDPTSRMLYLQPDMAGFAESARLIAPPGSRWSYSSPSTLILSRIIRDAVAATRRTCCDSPIASCSIRSGCATSRSSSTPPARRSARPTCSRRRATGRASEGSTWTTAWSAAGGSCPRAGSATRLPRRREQRSATARDSSRT
jgi:hypothetical protein